MLPVILSSFSILSIDQNASMRYMPDSICGCMSSFISISYNFINYVFCDICITKLFKLYTLYFVKDDKNKYVQSNYSSTCMMQLFAQFYHTAVMYGELRHRGWRTQINTYQPLQHFLVDRKTKHPKKIISLEMTKCTNWVWHRKYLDLVTDVWHQTPITRLRATLHILEIERGHYSVPRTPVNDRHSCVCKIVDEATFLLICEQNADLREDYKK